MITVGVDTYLTVDEIQDYFLSSYMLDETVTKKWNSLSVLQKERLLKDACIHIDSLYLTGRKSDCNQNLEFPRNPDTSVPEVVKEAQFIIALSYLDTNRQKRYLLQKQGVSSISVGNATESYELEKVCAENLPEAAKRLLRRWLNGSFHVG